MTQPKISAEAWEQAVSDFVKEAPKHLRAQSMYDSAWIKQRARELTAAQPAVGNDAVRALAEKWRGDPDWMRKSNAADELEAALASLESFAASHSGDEQRIAEQDKEIAALKAYIANKAGTYVDLKTFIPHNIKLDAEGDYIIGGAKWNTETSTTDTEAQRTSFDPLQDEPK